jgi:hypothetical protein
MAQREMGFAHPFAAEFKRLAYEAVKRKSWWNGFAAGAANSVGVSPFCLRQDCGAAASCGVRDGSVAGHQRGHDGAIDDEPERVRDLGRFL